MKYFLYILECADNSLYTGCTNDLKRRLDQHNNSKRGARYTKARRPVKLLYTEELMSRSEALRREAEIKHLKRNEKLKLISASIVGT